MRSREDRLRLSSRHEKDSMTTCILLLDTLALGAVAVVSLIQAGALAAELAKIDPATVEPAAPRRDKRKLGIVAGLSAGCLLLAFASVAAAVRVNQ